MMRVFMFPPNVELSCSRRRLRIDDAAEQQNSFREVAAADIRVQAERNGCLPRLHALVVRRQQSHR